jgi:DNA-binding transcriptional LysR family regulator
VIPCYLTGMENWNDLKLILAIHRAQSLGGGATALGINHSTAFRRLNALEEKVGTRLFERLPGGVYHPTAEGERVAGAAERIETEADTLVREVTGSDRRLTGALRVTSSETLAYSVLTKQLARFREAHPGIVVELVVDNRVLSLSRREADIALRVTRPKEPDLFGRKLADISWTVYATKALLKRHGRIDSTDALADRPFVGWGAEVTGIAAADWLAERIEPSQVVYRANSLINQFIAAKAGIGFVVLPRYLGDIDAALVPALDGAVPELTRELWIVTHSDLKKTARVRAFFDIVGEGLAGRQQLFAGDAA